MPADGPVLHSLAMAARAYTVLVLTPQLPYPPEQGASLRNYHLLRYLAPRHRVTLVSFGQGVPAPLRDLCHDVLVVPAPRRGLLPRLAGTLDPRPDLALRLRSPAFSAAVRRAWRADRPDLVQCEALELFPAAAPLPAPLVLDAHNAEWRLQQRAAHAAAGRHRLVPALYSRLQAAKLRRYEGRALRRAAAAIAVSPADRADLLEVAPATRVCVIPNGVDAAAYAPRPEVPEDPNAILFAGKMDFRPNVEAARWLAGAIMPLVWRARPAARLTIFGMAPTPEVRALAADRRVVVTGHLPGIDAERQALARAAVVAVPLLSGGGTRLKVLNALAMARPLVSTPLGAAGYDLRPGRELLLAAGAPDFAAALLRLLDDRALARRLGAAGRALVADRYDWRRLLPALDELYAEVAGA